MRKKRVFAGTYADHNPRVGGSSPSSGIAKALLSGASRVVGIGRPDVPIDPPKNRWEDRRVTARTKGSWARWRERRWQKAQRRRERQERRAGYESAPYTA